ncbi:MAG: acyl carrier protein [Solirubrobacterales bacterium]
MGMQGVERNLRRFIVEELLDEGHDGRDPLVTDAIDSLGVEQLVDYIGEDFGVRLVDEEINRENFASVPALAAFVESKLAGVR